MTADHTLEGQVQGILNEMWLEKLIPIALNVSKIKKGHQKYTIHFYDSRMRTAEVLVPQGELLRDVIRSAVLAQVANLSGPLSLPEEAS